MNGCLDVDVNEGLIGQLFGQNLQTFPESTCQTEYMDILGGDMNDGRLPGQRTRFPFPALFFEDFLLNYMQIAINQSGGQILSELFGADRLTISCTRTKNLH